MGLTNNSYEYEVRLPYLKLVDKNGNDAGRQYIPIVVPVRSDTSLRNSNYSPEVISTNNSEE